MSARLDRTMELQKFVADHVDDPDAIVERLERAEHEAFLWYVLQRVGGMTGKTVDDIEQIADMMWTGGFRRTA